MFLYQIAFYIARRKKNFAPSALNGTKGWMLGNVWLYISFQNRQQEPRLAVRGNGTGPTDYISTNGLRFPRLPGPLCCYVMSLGVTLRCRQKCQRPATPDGAASDFLKRRAGSVGATSGSPPPNATQPPLWWACLAFEPCLLTFLGQHVSWVVWHVNQLLYSDNAI